MTEPEKQCNKCLAFKPLGEFGNDKSRKDGKKPACKCCANEAARQRRAANPEKYKEAARQYRAANPEKCKEAQRKYRAANPEKRKESHRQYYTRARHARNQCSVFNAQDPNKWERLEAKLKALNPLRT